MVSEVSCLPRVLQPVQPEPEAFQVEDGASTVSLALLAQVLQSIVGHEIPVANLLVSDPTSETALVCLLTIIEDGTITVRGE